MVRRDWFGFGLLKDEPGFAITLNGIMISDPYQRLSHVQHADIQIEITPAQAQYFPSSAILCRIRGRWPEKADPPLRRSKN